MAWSDCHDWRFYPKHDESVTTQEEDLNYFTRAKCLPTFKGLLMMVTSPGTRIKLEEAPTNENHITSFQIGDKLIELSDGLNAIIGENGTGKSSLIKLLFESNPSDSWVQEFRSKANIIMAHTADAERTNYIEQNSIIEKMRDQALFPKDLFEMVDHSTFREKIDNYTTDMISLIEGSILVQSHLDDLPKRSFLFEPKFESKTHYVTIELAEDFSEVANPHKLRVTTLARILSQIKAEIENQYYSDGEVDVLQGAYAEIYELYKTVEAKSSLIEHEREVRSRVSEALVSYQSRVQQSTGENEMAIRSYRQRKTQFKNSVLSVMKDCYLKQDAPRFPDVKANRAGISRNQKNGFVFVRTAKYATSEKLLDAYHKFCFVKDYPNVESLLSIRDNASAAKAVLRASDRKWADQWKTNAEKFKGNFVKERDFIQNPLDRKSVGNTLGELSLTYYKYISYNKEDWDVLMIDQPEDNISNNKILGSLIGFFNSMRNNKQVIFITHNPLLVVNQDVDNVVCIANNDNGAIEIIGGCLEDEENRILDLVAENMDGGRDAIEQRLRIYGN